MYLEREIRTFPNPYIGKLATLHSCNSCISKNSESIRAPDVSIDQVYMMLARPVGLIFNAIMLYFWQKSYTSVRVICTLRQGEQTSKSLHSETGES